jgi:N-acetylneuraminate synthase
MSDDRVFVIAEAGVNHNGDPALAHRLVQAGADAGADAVKFQTFRTERVVVSGAPKVAYQKSAGDEGEDQAAMLRRLELAPEAHFVLKAECEKRGLEFLSTPFDLESLALLVEQVGVRRMKVPSGEITNGPFLLAVARTDLPIILSTGMATLEEVEAALSVLAYGAMEPERPPDPEGCEETFREAFASREGSALLAQRVTLLHCTSAYPTDPKDSNLRAMDTLAERFGLPVGLSDHTPGIAVPIAAVARGARVIEKHFTLDRSLPGPDHAASLEPGELRDMISGIRTVEAALGRAEKGPAACEEETRRLARRSLVALRPIRCGERFGEDNVGALRPGTGLSPMAWWRIRGRAAERDYAPGDPIEADFR